MGEHGGMIAKCPRCGKEVQKSGNRVWPFCSERCKLIDLGNWISGSYRIPTRSTDEDEDGDRPREDSEKE
jgi:uncharacterized protein